VPGADHFAFGGFDPDRAAALDQMRLGSVISLISPPAARTAASSARASAAEPPRDICALAGLASSAAM
jgi:hypothetical protein